MKIAIFSGVIPSTTFIEHVIKGIAEHHKVYLFGVVDKQTVYKSSNVKQYITPKSHWRNLIVSSLRVFKLFFKRPKDLFLLLKTIKRYTSLYDKWIWFTKFLPIVLYRPDVLHLQWARDLEFYWFLKTTYDIPIVLSLRGAHIHYTPIIQPSINALYAKLFPNIDAFHAVSKSMKDAAIGFGAQASRISIIHSPLNSPLLDSYSPPQTKCEPMKVLSVGRFHWVKGYSYALQAMSFLKAKDINCHYTIIAQGDLPEAIVFQLNQLDLNSIVTILPGMPHDQLLETMHAYDALLLPSLNEGIANVVLEAMALGVPVISTDCGGMREVVKPGETGWLVPVRDAEALANAVVDVMQTDAQVLERIVQQAHDFVKAEFAAEDSIGQFLELYEGLGVRD